MPERKRYDEIASYAQAEKPGTSGIERYRIRHCYVELSHW